MINDTCNKILFYGLSPLEEDFLMRKCASYEYRIAEDVNDLIAIPADLLVVNPNELDFDDQKLLATFYKEIEPAEVSLILTDDCSAFKDIKKVYVEKNLFGEGSDAEIVFLKNLHQTKRDYDFSRRLADIIRLQRDIVFNAGITTKELACLEEKSERTIKRNIETLNMAGAIIEHRKIDNGSHGNTKGWFSEMAIWEI